MADTHLDPAVARAQFKHQPLDLSTNEIRLLIIDPNLYYDGLDQCQVYHSSRHRDRSRLSIFNGYNALSYEWGPPLKDHIILMNGLYYEVRSNPHAFYHEPEAPSL